MALEQKLKGAATAAQVAKIEAFAGLTRKALDECATLALKRVLSPGRVIFCQGEPCSRVQALLSGWVRISQAGRDGEQALLRFIGPGELFGWFGIFAGRSYPGEAQVVAQATEISWSEHQISELIVRYPRIATNLLAVAARRLAELQVRVREIATRPAEQRIANSLLRLAAKSGCSMCEDRVELAWPLTRKDIGAISATTLYTASRVLSYWQRRGIILSASRRIAINSIPELMRIADLD